MVEHELGMKRNPERSIVVKRKQSHETLIYISLADAICDALYSFYFVEMAGEIDTKDNSDINYIVDSFKWLGKAEYVAPQNLDEKESEQMLVPKWEELSKILSHEAWPSSDALISEALLNESNMRMETWAAFNETLEEEKLEIELSTDECKEIITILGTSQKKLSRQLARFISSKRDTSNVFDIDHIRVILISDAGCCFKIGDKLIGFSQLFKELVEEIDSSKNDENYKGLRNYLFKQFQELETKLISLDDGGSNEPLAKSVAFNQDVNHENNVNSQNQASSSYLRWTCAAVIVALIVVGAVLGGVFSTPVLDSLGISLTNVIIKKIVAAAVGSGLSLIILGALAFSIYGLFCGSSYSPYDGLSQGDYDNQLPRRSSQSLGLSFCGDGCTPTLKSQGIFKPETAQLPDDRVMQRKYDLIREIGLEP